MNKVNESDDMRDEYDFLGATKVKHRRAYRGGSNVILLEPDVAKKFKDSKAVDHALRMLITPGGIELERKIKEIAEQDEHTNT